MKARATLASARIGVATVVNKFAWKRTTGRWKALSPETAILDLDLLQLTMFV